MKACRFSRIMSVGALILALCAAAPLARASECDNDIPAEQFQDNGWQPDPKDKKKKKPPHQLIKAECEGCQKFYDDLQKALDDCNAKKLNDAKDKLPGTYGDLSDKGKAKQDALVKQRDDALDALGGKAKEPPKGKAEKDLKDEVKKKWEALKGQLGSCKNATPSHYEGLRELILNSPFPKPERGTTTGGGEQPGTGTGVQPGGGQPPAPAGGAPGEEVLPTLPPGDCWKSQAEKDKFYQDLKEVEDELDSDAKAATTHGIIPAAVDKIKKKQAEAKALRDAAGKKKWPCPSPTPTPQEHGMVPRQPGKTGETCAVLVATGKIKVETSGTGETIGHVADLKIQNLTDQPLTCAIPPMILESASGKNQHYACPSGQTVALNPHQTKTVPMNGVCLNRNKPPVAKGVSGELVMNEANPSGPQNPNSRLSATDAGKLLRSCAAKYTAADQLQKSGALKNLPYHDPQKQKDIVVQWSTWMDPEICQMTGSPPATKEDLRKVVYKQIEKQGPMTPEKKKKVDQGIDTIFEKVELTSAKAKDLEKPGPVFGEPVSSSEKAGPLFQPTTVAQPGDVVHVEPQSPRDREGAAAATGAKGHWMVKVKLPSGKVVEVWFETDEKPPLEVCNYIKINKTGTSAGGKETVVKDYEKTTAPTKPPKAPPQQPPTESVPPTVSEPTQTATSSPPLPAPTPTATQPPQLPGGKPEAEKPKGEAVKPTEPLEPPFELPPWLKPWWEAAKASTVTFVDLPGGKDALGGVIARLNVEIRNAMINGNEERREFYEKLKKKLTDIYNSMPDE